MLFRSIKEALGYSPPQQIAETMGRRATSLREWQYGEIFEILNSARMESISGNMKVGLIESALIKIQAILK